MLTNHFQGFRMEEVADGCDGVGDCDEADNGVSMN